MWRWLEQYFTFTRGEKNAILVLIFLTIAVFILPSAYIYFVPVRVNDNSPYEKEIDAFIKEYKSSKLLAAGDSLEDSTTAVFNPFANVELSSKFKRIEKKKTQYFEFDPNKIAEADWIQLGFSQKQAQAIERLKSKGYKFHAPEDLKRVYVVSAKNYNLLLPFIRIDSNDFPPKVFPPKIYPAKPKPIFMVDINIADSSLFESQRGIGPSLSGRIVRYRRRLGGFVSREQIKEVWGMPDSTYQSLKDRFSVNSDSVHKININTADFGTLSRHPYINYSSAKLITAYRQQHGNFKTTEELLKIPVITDSIYRKFEPYISVE